MEDEINKLQEHVSSSIEGVVKDFKAFWRPKEAEAHLCAHKALSNKSLSADAAGEAVAACFEPSAAKETQMGEELMAFQQNLRACHSSAQSALTAKLSGKEKADEDEVTRAYLKAVQPCVEAELKKLPALLERIKADPSGGAAPKSSSWFR